MIEKKINSSEDAILKSIANMKEDFRVLRIFIGGSVVLLLASSGLWLPVKIVGGITGLCMLLHGYYPPNNPINKLEKLKKQNLSFEEILEKL